MRVLISGGPGAGCTSTALAMGERFGVAVLDSDQFFHKPTDPPFQVQYSPEERRAHLQSALSKTDAWVLSGSVATWGLAGMNFTHGVFLQIDRDERLRRLERRQRLQFGARIDDGGDMVEEHQAFMKWARDYESRMGVGRNLKSDRAFVEDRCERVLICGETIAFQELVAEVVVFLSTTEITE